LAEHQKAVIVFDRRLKHQGPITTENSMATALLRYLFLSGLAKVSVPAKTTDEVDWINPLKAYIRQTYDDPEKFTEVRSLFLSIVESAHARNVQLYRDYGRIHEERVKTLQDEIYYTGTTANSNSSTFAFP
jgi:hypothetical protein